MPETGDQSAVVVGFLYLNEYMPDRDQTVCQIVDRDQSYEHGDDVPVFVIEFADGWRHKARAECLQPWFPL